MASLQCGSFHAPSIYHFLWMTCHICYKVRASLLCGSFHVPWNGHSGRNILSKMSPLIHLQITSFSEWLVTLSMDVGTTVGPFMCLQMVTLAKSSLTTLEQANGIYPVWVSPYFIKLLLPVNNLSHFEQGNVFSTVWVLSCAFEWALWQKDSFQNESLNASSNYLI